MAITRRVTDWFSRVWHWKFTRNETAVRVVSEEEHLTKALGRFEPYVIRVQKVLIWEKPLISVLCVIAVNLLFWLAVNFECRFYGFIFWMILAGFLYDMWVERIWPEISVAAEARMRSTDEWTPVHPSVLSVPEISHYLSQTHMLLKEYYTWLKNLRGDQPGLFCCGMSCCFIGLTLIGRAVPGPVIAYVLVMLLMTGPGVCIHLLPPSVIEKLQFFTTLFKIKGKDTDSEVEDYLPDQTGENLALLQLAGEPLDFEKDDDQDPSLNGTEDFGLDTETGDSSNTQTSFTTGVSVMPSHDEGSTDGLDVSEFDLASSTPSTSAPSQQQKKSESQQHSVHSRLDPDLSDTDDEDIAGINFQSSHFNGDSSDEDEKAFTQGLTFSEVGQSTQSPASVAKAREHPAPSGIGEMLTSSVMYAVSKNISSLGAMGQSLLSTVISSGTKQPEPKKQALRRRDERSSSDESEEDFEMISQDDLS
ncbi:reticulophagy regulator 3-like [Periplaneta americana]|uniref:reticulophagy regulator 3-like n=1 Tax=Periplaneta americana TaxID=6978 RepID=UPI0037E92C42